MQVFESIGNLSSIKMVFFVRNFKQLIFRVNILVQIGLNYMTAYEDNVLYISCINCLYNTHIIFNIIVSTKAKSQYDVLISISHTIDEGYHPNDMQCFSGAMANDTCTYVTEALNVNCHRPFVQFRSDVIHFGPCDVI